MSRFPRRLLSLLLALLLLVLTFSFSLASGGPRVTRSGARVPVADQLAQLTAGLDRSAIPSDILHLPAVAGALNGATDEALSAESLSPTGWYQALLEMRRSQLDGPTLPRPSDVREAARQAARSGAVPLGLLHFDYAALQPDAVERGLLALEDGRLVDVPGRTASPYTSATLFAGAPLWEQVYAGQDVTFRLDRAFFYGNRAAPETVVVDFGDGSGSHTLAFGDAVTVRYSADGPARLTLSARFADGSRADAAATLTVRPQVPTEPDVSWENLVAALPYLGQSAVYDAYIFYGDGHTQIEKPLIFVEGFDFENSISWPEVLAIVSAYGFADGLLADGYDVIILNFENGTDYVQRNSFALVDLIERVQAIQVGDEPLVVAGASMGGIIGRYALAWMEQNGMSHDARLLLTFDSPHQTANVPLGVQEWVTFFADYNADAEFFIDALDAPAARQLLVYHHLSYPDPSADALRAQLFADLAALGDYPTEPRLVAVANGSGAGPTGGQTGNGGTAMQPGTKIVDWDYSVPLLIDVVGNVWAVPDITPTTRIFEGEVYIFFFFGDGLDVYASGTAPYDNAPGGYRPTQQQMSEFDPTYDFLGFVIDLGEISTNFPNHAFIPTVSALDARDNQGNPLDLFHDLNNDAQVLNRTPYDAVYFPAGANEEHVVVTEANAAFLSEQINIASEVTGVITPLVEPVIIPATGGSFGYRVELTNNMNSSEPITLRIEVRESDGDVLRVIAQRSLTLGPSAFVQRQLTQVVPAALPAGTYSQVLVVTTAGGITTESSFEVTKLAP